MHTLHAYAVLKSDENYVYLINPWDSEETLKVEITKLVDLFANFEGRSCDMGSVENMNKKMLFKPTEKKDFF